MHILRRAIELPRPPDVPGIATDRGTDCSYIYTYDKDIYIYICIHMYVYSYCIIPVRRGSSYIGSHDAHPAVMHILREVPMYAYM